MPTKGLELLTCGLQNGGQYVQYRPESCNGKEIDLFIVHVHPQIPLSSNRLATFLATAVLSVRAGDCPLDSSSVAEPKLNMR